ncbi:hypothetical protein CHINAEXTREME_03070 [Halobiforma lacisalsi AJ5]|uniref:Halobacterial output domain-containing protein n=1 Tax=Natronobacterium lacisalsi AJ5 TaxID=358396 RepID=A0A1P8LM05_NATLA|nr:HalOD1 output domain-containing protein [Halobiforma lacisalsi]APW96814.1 hypothetical protein CHINAEXTREME_03070 [Halobiforma lacisalsi AJ5]
MHSDPPISHRVVEKVAEREGVPSTELHPPLHSAVDTDALDAICRTADTDRGRPTIEFEYEGYTVRIANGSEITIEEPSPLVEPDREFA